MNMTTHKRQLWLPLGAALGFAFAGFGIAAAADVTVALAGAQEVPSVKSDASGVSTITVDADKSVHGSVTTKGIVGTAAHVHEGAVGKSGAVVFPLEKSGDTYTVPANAKLTDAQFESFKAGNLYVNVHSAAHKDGEIRGQLKP